jgi:endoglucanase
MRCGKENAPKLLLDAHSDVVGMMVTHILDDGFLKVAQVGGLDTRILQAAQVDIYSDIGVITGVVCSTPPHLSDGDTSLPKVTELFIDTCYSKEGLEKILRPGAYVGFHGGLLPLQNGTVAGQGLDDKACAASLLLTAEKLRDTTLECDIIFLFSAQEEIGAAGAMTGAYGEAPDWAIILDVNFALMPDCEEHRCIRFGKGGGFSISASTSMAFTRDMIDYAKGSGIPYQCVVEATSTGTNAGVIATSRNGIPCAVLSIPLKNMHTPVEVAALSDIEDTASLLAGYIKHRWGVK